MFAIINEPIKTFNPKYKGATKLTYSDCLVYTAMLQFIRFNKEEKTRSRYFGGQEKIAVWFGLETESTIKSSYKRLGNAKLIKAVEWCASNKRLRENKWFRSKRERDAHVANSRGWNEGVTAYEVMEPAKIKTNRHISLTEKEWERV